MVANHVSYQVDANIGYHVEIKPTGTFKILAYLYEQGLQPHLKGCQTFGSHLPSSSLAQLQVVGAHLRGGLMKIKTLQLDNQPGQAGEASFARNRH